MLQRRSFLDVADWVRRFKADPIEVLQARDEWLVIATAHVEDPGVSDIAPDFVGLTRVLVAWADHTGIDRAGALRELCRRLCAIQKPGAPWGRPGISEAGVVGWDVRRRIIEDLMAQAIGVVERITDAAIVRAKSAAPEAAPEERQSDPFVPLEADLEILQALAESSNTLVQVEIIDRSGRGERTVKDRLPVLEELGFVARPFGPKRGYAITGQGRGLLPES